ncbi:hypothetical protein ACHMW6_06160 [Pseudoduganella sp. UC29_106]|uniref:hypothetical protein n=1 Tax=Pseudoduganella sp. UC29_106 TaxID=3374553 RepID=UPI00375644E0
MKTALHFGVAVLIVAISGCASPPTTQELALADYGPAPKNYKVTVTAHMQMLLKDPDSARYGFYIEPVKGYAGRQRVFGWATCVMINAKNSFGGYTGAQQYFFLIRNDKIVFYDATDGRNVLSDNRINQSCATLQPA